MGKLAVRGIAYALFACQVVFAASVPPLVCASGSAVATVDLRVSSPSPQSADHPLPLRTMNRIEEGDTIRYRPVLRPHQQRKGEVTLVLAPADKRAAMRGKLLIFPSRPASQPQQWVAPWRASVVAFVYGPSGLSVKKVEAFLNRDDELVGELADYADKTAKTEALIAALDSPDSSREAIGAALQGFSSQFGNGVQLDRNTPANQQAMVMFRTLNPNIATYDPLAAQGAQPVGQTAGLATSVAEMFFGTPVGLAAGGTAMLLNLGALAFPHSEFRSAFSQPMPDDTLGLCGKVGAAAPHTRVAYLWATRIPNVPSPRLTVGKANSLPAGLKSPMPLTGPDKAWKFLDRARDWTLQPDRGKPVPVKLQVLANTKSVELDLGKDVKPGRYSLSAKWDWDSFQIDGFFDVQPLANFSPVKLTPAAQDRFVANSGKVPLTLEGADFEFVTKVQIEKLNDEFASPSAIPFLLPHGIRKGVQDRMDIQIDTDGLNPGAYKLIVSQLDGKSHDVGVKVLPALPVIDNLPLTVNQGVSSISFDLKGKRLDLLKGLDLSQGSATLGAASAGGTERRVILKLAPGMSAGTTLSLRASVADRSQPVTIAEALRIVGPQPAITGVVLSHLPAQPVQLDHGELPRGLTMTAMMHAAHVPSGSALRLECEQTAAGAITLHPGQQNGSAKLEQLTSDRLFLTFDTGAWINGCRLQATITSALGDSAPHRIGRIVNLPLIEQFQLSTDPVDGADGEVSADLIGKKLETIDKVGWASDQAAPVTELPQPVSGDGVRQKLEVHLAPPPAFDAVLYVWLRGDSQPRLTTVRAN